MAVTRFSARLDGDPDPVFATLIDPTTRADWDHAVASVRVLTEGALQLGTRLEIRRRLLARPRKMTVAVNELDQVARNYGEIVLDGPLAGTDSLWQVEMTGWGSHVSLVYEPKLSGPLSPLVRRRLRRDASRTMSRLRARFKR
jgi:hypothetical protein